MMKWSPDFLECTNLFISWVRVPGAFFVSSNADYFYLSSRWESNTNAKVSSVDVNSNDPVRNCYR